ncbi:MAG: beta-galactosidase [Kiritimatiellae bacterium]|nr:beta-galactosidase [Kiritimatiellia bacterium]
MNNPEAITITRDYLVIDGRPRFIFGGDFNYTRTPRAQWRDRLLKMKAAGMNTVAFYMVWGYHEPEPGRWDWAGEKDVAAFLDLIHEEGMWAIARMGPFVHGEWRNGGLPQWLLDRLGPSRVRTNDPDYLALTEQWYERELAIIVPRLVTRGGHIVMVQLENELGSAGSKGDDIPRGSADPEENARHVLHYYGIIRRHGVDVPIIDISHWPGREEQMERLVDTGGGYPVACFGCDGEVSPIDRQRWDRHVRPMVSIESGSAAFVRFYDLPPYKNTTSYQGPLYDASIVEAIGYAHLAEGYSGINYYMDTYGQHADGANERMLPERDVNFQCPITVVGSLRKSYRVLKRMGWLLRSFEQEMLKAQPNATWATAISHGKAHPGVDQTGDLFENYHRESPEAAPGIEHVTRVEAAGRCTRGLNLSETNFLIMRNTRNHGARWLRDIRVETNARGIPCETTREYPVRTQMALAPNQNKIMPFYVRLQPRTFLEYSTADLLDRRPFGDKATQLILYGNANETLETAVVVERQCAIRTHGDSVAFWENQNTVTLVGRPGPTMQISVFDQPRPLRIVHLEHELAGEVWDVAAPDGAVVASSSVCLLESRCQGQTTTVKVQSQRTDFSLWMLCPQRPTFRGPGLTMQGEYHADFGLFEGCGTLAAPEKRIAWRRRREGANLVWEAQVTPVLLEGVADVILRSNYRGACARAWLDKVLISDHYFGRFLMWEVGLRAWLKAPATLRLEFEGTQEADVAVVTAIESEWQIDWAAPPSLPPLSAG